ncbi:MAG: c-type cytochrome [Verrucomicrobiota bacterium]
MLLSALSTGHKTALLVVAGVFIVFALCSSFVFTRMNPNYPGKRLLLFILVCVLLTAAMLGSVIAFASEPKEKAAEKENKAAAAHPRGEAPPSAPSSTGNATAGKALFASQGCSACHTFKPAGSTAQVGPDLDHLAADAQKANRGSLAQYTRESIVDPGAYVVPGYSNGVMPGNFASLGDTKIADLVAFLTSGSS